MRETKRDLQLQRVFIFDIVVNVLQLIINYGNYA